MQQIISQTELIPSFPDDLEALIADLECELLMSVTPEQFQVVQRLVRANRLLVEADSLLAKAKPAPLPSREALSSLIAALDREPRHISEARAARTNGAVAN